MLPRFTQSNSAFADTSLRRSGSNDVNSGGKVTPRKGRVPDKLLLFLHIAGSGKAWKK